MPTVTARPEISERVVEAERVARGRDWLAWREFCERLEPAPAATVSAVAAWAREAVEVSQAVSAGQFGRLVVAVWRSGHDELAAELIASPAFEPLHSLSITSGDRGGPASLDAYVTRAVNAANIEALLRLAECPRLTSDQWTLIDGRFGNRPSIRRRLAAHPVAPTERLAEWAACSSAPMRAAVASNPACPLPILLEAARRKPSTVQISALMNPRVPEFYGIGWAVWAQHIFWGVSLDRLVERCRES